MTHDLKPYPARKNSGLLWLGEIPAHWEVRRNGRLFTQRNETGFADLPILEVSLNTGVRVRDFGDAGRKQMMTDRDKYKRAAAGDLAYNMMRMWQGAVGIAPVDGLVSPAYVVARPFPETEAAYFNYLFRTHVYMNEVDSYSRGIVKDRNRLYWDEFKQMPSAFPPPNEQKAIVRFLDVNGRMIGRLVRAKRRLIDLLNEQKQAIIQRAVTRGLDSNMRLKPSGIEWLGDVPEHWEVLPLRRVSRARCDGPFGSGLKSTHYTASGVRVIRLQNIGPAAFRNTDTAFISREHYSTLGDHTVRAGDLLIAGLGDERIPPGRACVAPAGIEPAMVKADCFRFRLIESRIYAQFAAYHLTATAVVAAAALSSGATRQRVNLEATAGRALAMPPVHEQTEIVQLIEQSLRPLEDTNSRVHREIELLREYRTRLIADVVTGKLDVRGVELPALDEDKALDAIDLEDDADVEEVEDAAEDEE
jgi:type I restriction enzyme S subunit